MSHFAKSKFVSGVHLFITKVGVEESIVLQSKNTNNAKSGVRFKQQIRGL
jgi:hypothetical protein